MPVSAIHSLDHFHKAMENFRMKSDQRVQIRCHRIAQNPVHGIAMVLRNTKRNSYPLDEGTLFK